jgi:hypothetical protein
VKSEPFKLAVEAKDIDAMRTAIADDAVFRSPAVFKPYEGADAVIFILSAVTRIFEDFRYTDQLSDDDAEALVFEARVGDKEVQGIDMLRFDGEGRVRELTVLIRPLRGLEAVVEAMARELQAAGMGTPEG